MTWADAGEIAKAIGAVATAAAAWFAAITAYRGLEKWRGETIGKRKAELAADVLAATYEMEAILRAAREPWVLPHEMVQKEGVPDHIATDASYAPEARLLAHQDFFGRYRALNYEFAAVFGREAANALDGLWRIRLEINWAVSDMLRHKELRRTREKDDRELWDSWYRVAFRQTDESKDAVHGRIREHVAAIEAACRPAIEARSTG